MKCPGQDMRYWKPGDIFNAKCTKCGGTVEFFKDEVRRKCRCGHAVTNPKLDFGCAEWCPYAEQCIGAIPEEVRARQRAQQENSLRDRVALEMKRYFGKDLNRIDHALKVARFLSLSSARLIFMKLESMKRRRSARKREPTAPSSRKLRECQSRGRFLSG